MPATAVSPPVRGACPGVGAPMAAADGMLLRVRLPGGAVGTDGLRVVAEVAERYGSGTVELTVRANLQIRGVRPADVDAAADRLAAAGLADPDPARDERRDVLVAPLAGHDPTERLDLSGVGPEVARRLAAASGLDGLPPKFGVVLDGGGYAGSVRGLAADVALGAVRAADGAVVVQVALGEALDASAAGPALVVVPDAVPAVVHVALAAARLCAATGERMAALVEQRGRARAMADLAETELAERIQAAGVAESAGIADPSGSAERSGLAETAGRAGVSGPAGKPGRARMPTAWTPGAGLAEVGGARPAATVASALVPWGSAPGPVIGVLPHRRPDLVNVGAAPLLGRTGPAELRRLADLADASGAAVRLTPWRGVVLAGVSRMRGGAIAAGLAASGFSPHPDDPAHLVSACVGLPGCASSRADTARAARALLDGPGGPAGRIHLSGCDKRCGAGDAPVAVADDDGSFAPLPLFRRGGGTGDRPA